MYQHPAYAQYRHHSTPSIASVSTIRAADPFLVQHQNGDVYGSPAHNSLFHNPGSGSQQPPVPPARSSSLTFNHESATTADRPGSPLIARVPSVQVIHPTPTKKKGRPRSTASGDTAVGGSPSQRPPSRLSGPERRSGSSAAVYDEEEAKKARAREKGRDRQRRKRERDKAAKGESNPSLSRSSLAPSHSMSVPSSVSSTYSSLPHTQSMYSINTSPNASLVVSNSSTSLSGASSPTNLFSPALAGDIIWTGKSRRTSGSQTRSHLCPGSPPPKRRKSEPESDDFRLGLGVSLLQHDGNSTVRRPKPHRTASLALTEVSTAPSAPESDTSEWARSPTPPPIALPHLEETDSVTSQGQFFASTIIHACQVSGLADVLHTQLKLGKPELDVLRTELGLVYDRWAKGALEQSMGKVSLTEDAASTQTTTPHRPRAETHSGPPGSPIIPSHSRQRSLSSASMLARGLVLNPVPAPPAHTSTAANRWDSPKAHGPGSESPTHSNLQTPSTGQGTNFTIPNHDPVPNLPMSMPSQGSNHWRSHTDPAAGFDYRTNWRPVSGGLESPLTVTKAGKSPAVNMSGGGGSKSAGQTPANLTITPPHIRQHSAPISAVMNSANSTPMINPLPHLNQPHYAYAQMPNQLHQPIQHPSPHPYPSYMQSVAQTSFATSSHPYPSIPWTPDAASHPQSFRQAPLVLHPFTPPTPMPLKGGSDAPMHYMPSFIGHSHTGGTGTPPMMIPMGELVNGMGEPIPQLQQQQAGAMQTLMDRTTEAALELETGDENGSGMMIS